MRTVVERISRDVTQALRAVARMPVLASVIILSLGAGIGVNTVVFSWIQTRFFKPLPGVPGGARLHFVEPRTSQGLHPGMSWLDYRDLREATRTLSGLIAFRMVPFYVGESGRVDRAYGLLVSENYFSALDLRPSIGRFWDTDEVSRPGGQPVAIISHDFWQKRFAGAANTPGQVLRVNGQPLTVIGVAPERFQGTVLGMQFDLWVPATLAPVVMSGSRELDLRGARGYAVLGRLQPATTRAQAQADLDGTFARLATEYPDTNASMGVDVFAFWQSPRGPQRFLTTALFFLQGVMLFLLLAVCGNTATLVLARASARQREIGVRVALGASPTRVVTLLLAETVVLAVDGALVGATLAIWGTEALGAARPLRGLPIRFQTSIDAYGLAFAIGLGLLSGVIAGLPQAIHLARVGPLTALRTAARSAGRSRLRNALMGIQVALALIVLVAAGLFIKSFTDTRDIDPGFRRDGVLLAAYDFSGRPASAATSRTFAPAILERLRSLPAVDAAAIASSVPLDIHGLPVRFVEIEGRSRPAGDPDQALSNTVTPGYFQVMHIPILAGVDFTALTDTATSPQVLVNEAFVGRFVTSGAALGKRVTAGGRTYTIVGVVKNSLYNAFGEAPTPIVYFSYRDRPTSSGEIHVRSRGGLESAIAPELREMVRELDAELPIFNIRTLAEHVETNLIFRRVPARIFTVLGPLLLLLTSIGIYAVVSYSVSRRTAEIGVRLALGATTMRLVSDVMRDNLRVIVPYALAATLIAAVLVRGLSFHASGIVSRTPFDLTIFLGVPALLLLVASLACWFPARRAAGVDPVVALRAE
jgi:putative ABC transport system permease protein